MYFGPVFPYISLGSFVLERETTFLSLTVVQSLELFLSPPESRELSSIGSGRLRELTNQRWYIHPALNEKYWFEICKQAYMPRTRTRHGIFDLSRMCTRLKHHPRRALEGCRKRSSATQFEAGSEHTYFAQQVLAPPPAEDPS